VTALDMNMISGKTNTQILSLFVVNTGFSPTGMWFNATHATTHYKQIHFPGWVYGPISGGYNMRQLLNANYKR